MHDTGCLGLVYWDNPEGWYREGFSEVILPDGDGSKVGIINFLIQIDPTSDVIIRSFDCSVVPADEEE